MGAMSPVEREESEEMEEFGRNDLQKGEEKDVVDDKFATRTTTPHTNYHSSLLRTLNPTNPLRVIINNGTSRPPLRTPAPVPVPPRVHHPPHPPPPLSQPRSTPNTTPTPQQAASVFSLNSRSYTNKLWLFIYMVHKVGAIGLVGFLIYKAIEGFLQGGRFKRKEQDILKHYLPQVEASCFLSIILAFLWQKAVRVWPKFMVHFILWSSFVMSLSAGILLICFQKPSTDACGVALIAYAIGNGLYSCWVTQRTSFCTKVLMKSLEPLSKFPDLNHPSYYMLVAGFLWMSLWILAVIGALNFYLPPLVILGLVLSLAWTTEVMRNVANLTVSRVIALYYLRGMQSSTYFCFHRALTKNLGSAALGSVFVPTIEALRILARGLNLVEGEDEFMFSCAHCCLSCMNSIFRFGNGWAYVQIAAYGKSFVKASQDTWGLFEKEEMESIVDGDIMSAVCFLSGVCSGSIGVIMVAPWTHTVHKGYTATISLLAFFVGYLMVGFLLLFTYQPHHLLYVFKVLPSYKSTILVYYLLLDHVINLSHVLPIHLFNQLTLWRNINFKSDSSLSRLDQYFIWFQTRISMALPHACVSCFYVCYAENPDNRLFDQTIPDHLQMLKSGRDVAVPTPRVPRRFNQ